MLCIALWLGDLAEKAPHANEVKLDVKFASTCADAEAAIERGDTPVDAHTPGFNGLHHRLKSRFHPSLLL